MELTLEEFRYKHKSNYNFSRKLAISSGTKDMNFKIDNSKPNLTVFLIYSRTENIDISN